jgi:hypothetical protein
MSSSSEINPFLLAYFNQIEGQVVFGDTKASLLIAGDAILLAIIGNFLKTVSGCSGDTLSMGCVEFSIPLQLVLISAIFMLAAMVYALVAASPASFFTSTEPREKEFFRIRDVASLKAAEFVDMFRGANAEDLERWALEAIYGKARHATRKFRLLWVAFHATLVSLAFLACGAILALVLNR